jgi:phage terminase small subunit
LEAKLKRSADKPRAPSDLRPETRRWFEHVTDEFALEQHHVRLLTLAGEAWDRCTQAREALDKLGLTVEDRFGFPRPRPEIAVERDSRLAFARLVRELDLDTEATPESARLPALQSNRRQHAS